MDSMDNFRERFEALEQRTEQLRHQTHILARQARWWRGIACGLGLLGLVSLPLRSGTAADTQPRGMGERMATLENKLSAMTFDGAANEVVITGANLRIVNGLGSTETTNGLGNLIVGYNELRQENPDCPRMFLICTDTRTGSHNVVVGKQHNFSRFGGVVVGLHNETNGDFSVVSGGVENTASGTWSAISGGTNNTTPGFASAVSSGLRNTASGDRSVVSGGVENTASGPNSAVSAGHNNTANGVMSAVSGGGNNTASGIGSAVSGGVGNTASGARIGLFVGHTTVSGGENNTASGEFSTVSGGRDNAASGMWAVISGGEHNTANGVGSSVGGGRDNAASGTWAAISGGNANTASGLLSSVSGGSVITQASDGGWAAGLSGGEVSGRFRSP